MGLFDTISSKAIIPGAEYLGDREFRTNDLGLRMERFTIEPDGTLLHHRTYRAAFQAVRMFAPELNVMVPIHRDITLFGELPSGEFGRLVVRFSDSRAEWVRPWNELSELHREYLTASHS